jgi:hypothetical protein
MSTDNEETKHSPQLVCPKYSIFYYPGTSEVSMMEFVKLLDIHQSAMIKHKNFI